MSDHKFKPLVRCANEGCEALVDPDYRPVCGECRRYSAKFKREKRRNDR